MEQQIKKPLGSIWKQSGYWWVQLQGGRMNFKTKKQALELATSLGIRR